jgi:hypothetical protein
VLEGARMIYTDIDLTPLYLLASAVLMALAALGAGITGYWWGALIPWPALEFGLGTFPYMTSVTVKMPYWLIVIPVLLIGIESKQGKLKRWARIAAFVMAGISVMIATLVWYTYWGGAPSMPTRY